MLDELSAVLGRARDLGFLGPGDPYAHREHAASFVEAWDRHRDAPPGTLCDLGAGGGVPGLVLAIEWPGTTVVLLEAAERRCEFLETAISRLGLTSTVSVAHGRAESLARQAGVEGRFALVTARSFGPPAVVAECAARLLAPEGVLIVAEPPDGAKSAERWPEAGLAALGLGPAMPEILTRRLVVIERRGPCPDRYPRRDGVPAKRPLF